MEERKQVVSPLKTPLSSSGESSQAKQRIAALKRFLPRPALKTPTEASESEDDTDVHAARRPETPKELEEGKLRPGRWELEGVIERNGTQLNMMIYMLLYISIIGYATYDIA